MTRLSIFLLTLGVCLRLIAINQPIIDAMTIRQTQTADAIKSQIVRPGFPMDPHTSWRGHLDARLVQEFPLYNFATSLLSHASALLVETDAYSTKCIDLSGKLISVLLWLLSFLALQAIWKVSDVNMETQNWANFLFVICPLEIFFGQAVMPEMMSQFLALSLVYLTIKYAKAASTHTPQQSSTTAQKIFPLKELYLFAPLWLTGTLAILVKLPSVSHLALLALALVLIHSGTQVLRSGWIWMGALASATCLKAWIHYAEMINTSHHFEQWAPSKTLWLFLGTLDDRLAPLFYLKIGAYITILIVTPLGLLLVCLGIYRTIRNWKTEWKNPLVLWTLSLIFFYLIWGVRTGSNQSYYNLPAVVPLCYLFGIGMTYLRSLVHQRYSQCCQPLTITVIFVILCSAIGGTSYLFRQDTVIYESAIWAKRNIPANDLVIFRANHRNDMIDYQHNPVFSYYSNLSTVIWSTTTPEWEKDAAISNASWIVITKDDTPTPTSVKLWEKFKGSVRDKDPLEWLASVPTDLVYTSNLFEVYKIIRTQ